MKKKNSQDKLAALKKEVAALLVEKNGMTQGQAAYKVARTDEGTLREWLREMKSRVQVETLHPPTWETAARIYMAVLENPKAQGATKAEAREEILRLARAFDATKAKADATIIR